MASSPLDPLRYATPTLAITAWWKRRQRRRRQPQTDGAPCAICRGQRFVVVDAHNARDGDLCVGCGSVPRQRALVTALAELGVDTARVHECSPSACTFRWLRHHAGAFVASYWWPERRPGARIGVFRNVDLQAQPFADGSFDVVVTQDVLEHVPEPTAALREVHRTLRPGGAHVFTVPRDRLRATRTRARLVDGVLRHELPPEYHRDPIDRHGALVVTDWGADLEARVVAAGAASCTSRCSAKIEVFVAVTPA